MSDVSKLAAEKGVHLNVKGKNSLLSSLTIAEAEEILKNPKKTKGIGKSKIEVIKKVLWGDERRVLHYFTSIIEFINGALNNIEALFDKKNRNKVIIDFLNECTNLPYEIKNKSKYSAFKKYFTDPDATLESAVSISSNIGKTRERGRQIINEILKSIVQAQKNGDCYSEKIHEFYINLFCLGASLGELDKIKKYAKYSVPKYHFKSLTFPENDLIGLACEYQKKQEEDRIFPCEIERFKLWIQDELGIPINIINVKCLQSRYVIDNLNNKSVFYCDSVKEKIRFLILKNNRGFIASEIASELQLDVQLVSQEMQRFPTIFGHPDSNRRYYLINQNIEDWMFEVFQKTAQTMIQSQLFDVPISQFKNVIIQANPHLINKLNHIESRVLAVHAVHSPSSQFVEIKRMRIGVIGCDGTYGARAPIIEAAKKLGSAFLPEELWEEVQSRFDGDRKYSYDQLLVRMERDKILTKKQYFALRNLKFIKYENATPDARPSEKLERYLKELLSDHNYQDNYFKKFLENACLNAKYK